MSYLEVFVLRSCIRQLGATSRMPSLTFMPVGKHRVGDLVTNDEVFSLSNRRWRADEDRGPQQIVFVYGKRRSECESTVEYSPDS
ncbi:hypothetical protein V9T40_013215 [Parthenolecanium corni]|uniref:Uncharacterized protein n=1 Tax=Parthenolecanium corni TaxID=536013 RepID=A0AAN9TIP7_9HEMI